MFGDTPNPCAGYIARPFAKETVFTLECRRCDPSFPTFLPGSLSLREGWLSRSRGLFPLVPQVQSALCPGVSRLHLLCSLYGGEPGSVSLPSNARSTAIPTALFVGVDSS